jgi:serine O-acetyltransferase
MEGMTFEQLLEINCFSESAEMKSRAAELLEWRYNCEVNCAEIDATVLFAHHARGCTIVASKICERVVIFQNVTIGSNMRYKKASKEWEGVGNPIICKNVVVADGAKILGPIVIGENTVVAAGAIVTKNMPANCVVYGVNKYKPKNPEYDLVFNLDMIEPSKIIEVNQRLIAEYNRQSQCSAKP